MPSPAAEKFSKGILKSEYYRLLVTDDRIKPIRFNEKQYLAHASLTNTVASWDLYLNELVKNFYLEIANPGLASYQSLYSIAESMSEKITKRFNTPNWENGRNFLVETTGYDPYSDWIWPQRRMVALDVKQRLNEILKVRHSFAHGFPIPSCSWTTSPSGRIF